jgi:hypothetical protein
MERLTGGYEPCIPGPNGCIFDECAHNKMLNRLAAYEDTGLTPEEVAELAKAKKDGRLLVLPCKVGTPVWSTMFRKIILDDNGKFIREEPTSNWPFDTDMISDWGECWFMTREEAEAALDKQKGE